MEKLSELCRAIALKIKLAAISGAKGEKPLELGVCFYLATYKGKEYYYEIYQVTRYALGDDLYVGGMGAMGVLTQSRQALFEKLSSMAVEELIALAHQALKQDVEHRNEPVPEFAFLANLDMTARVSPSAKD